MLSGFYTAASGVLVQQRSLNVLTNNIANVKTPGYRAERLVSTTFEHELMTRIENGNTEVIGTGDPIRVVREVPVNFENSALEATERALDVAIDGDGYFNIQTADPQGGRGNEEILLTRRGDFSLDEEGFLILPGVGRVLGRRGEIDLGGASDFTVTTEGEIFNSKGRRVDFLKITRPSGTAKVDKVENGLYRVENEDDNLLIREPVLYQRMIEQANIDINREYTLVIEAQRAFQSCSQALKIVDSMNQKAASEIASL